MVVINTAFKLLGSSSHNRWAGISRLRFDFEFFVSCT